MNEILSDTQEVKSMRTLGVARVVTEQEELKTLIVFLTWLLGDVVVPSSKKD